MNKPNVRLVSNVMIKKKLKSISDIEMYVPYELLPSANKNVNLMWQLSPEQQTQLDRFLFTAKRIVDVEESDEEILY